MRTAWFAMFTVTMGVFGPGCSESGDPAWLDLPRTEEAFGPYRFELPVGFKETPTPNMPGGIIRRSWIGPKNPPAEPVMTVAYLAHDLDISIDEPAWNEAADQSLDEMRQHCRSLSMTGRRRLQVNGLEAMRTEASGQLEGNIQVRAVVYVLADNQNVIMTMALDFGPGAARSIERLDESLLTLKRPGYVPPPRVATIVGQPNKRISLSEARRGFQSRLAPSQFESEPIPQPPERVFRTVVYKSDVGQLGAYLTPDPEDGRQHPAIVWITGGDCNTIGDVWSWQSPEDEQSASAYRHAGMVMMFPSLRGGNQNPGRREGLLGEVDDVLAAADFLAAQSYVDPHRIYLGGHSTGGTLVLLVAACSDRFRAVFSFGPIDDIAGYGREFLPFDFTNRRELELRAPILWLHSIESPTFVFEGEGGNAVSLRAMKAASDNEHVRLFAIEDKDHFTVLAPINELIAEKVLQDDGPSCNLAFTEAELAGPLSSSLAESPPPVESVAAGPNPSEALSELRRVAEERERERERKRVAEAIREDPSHPDYLKANLAELGSEEHFGRSDALDRLLNTNPDDVADKQIRAEIARGMRDVAFDGTASPPLRRKAIRGLVTWGSNYSVPLLLKLLDENSPFVKKDALAALIELQDERAIEPLAKQFAASTFGDDEIADGLRAFGPRAEDAVLKLASTDNPIKLRHTVQLLGDIGTSKSLRYFSKLRSNRRVMFTLQDELEAATAAIQRRAKESKSAGP